MSTILIANNFKDSSWYSMCYRLAFHLAERHEVVYMSYRPFFTERKVFMDGRLTVYSWSTKGRPTGLRDLFHFIRIYFRHRPRIVIGHFVGANISILASKLLSFFRVRTFEWYHTLSDQIEYDYGNIPGYKRFMRTINYKYFVDTVVPVSHLAARDYRGFYGLRNDQVVLNAIVDAYRGVDAEYTDAVLNVGFLGRFNPHKGIDILFKLIDDLPADRFRFRVAGDGPDKRRLEDLRRENVEYVGMLSFDQTRAFIEGCHMIIIPSYHDNLVTVGIETLMLKRCLILSRMTGLAEYLKPGEDAIVCEPSAEEFSRHLLELEADRARLADISQLGRETFLGLFGIDKHIRNVERLILG